MSYLSPYLRHRVITEEYVIEQALSLTLLIKLKSLFRRFYGELTGKAGQLRPKVWSDW